MLLGIWSGCLLLNGGNPLLALLRTFDHYFVGAFVSTEHAGVVLFTLLLGGTIGLVQKSGGALGLASLVKGLFTSGKKAALSTVALGSLLFFDDYSSILIVGNSLSPLLKAVRLSLPKFAFITHAMGSSLASLAPVSSWVGLQIGYLAAAYEQLATIPGGAAWALADPFLGFLQTLRFRFFPLTLLIFVLLTCVTGRDFGPMATAEEEKAATTDESASVLPSADAGEAVLAPGDESDPLAPKKGTPLRSRNALLPFAAVILGAFGGMMYQGFDAILALPELGRPALTLVNALRYADSVIALMWGSVAGWIVSLSLVLGQKLLTLSEAMGAWSSGIKVPYPPLTPRLSTGLRELNAVSGSKPARVCAPRISFFAFLR